ncbi:MAG: RodZ domain-containing protein [Synechococcaceae cyanobacterium]|nr:RodZ domain-containing protein [Synechococcaceae cyanobacterium]
MSASTPADQGASGSDREQQVLRSLGEELQRAREARGLSREALAERLRIGPEQLKALEEADAAHLPERVFVVAQLRRVAGALDLDLGDRLSQLRPSVPGGSVRPAARTSAVAPPRGVTTSPAERAAGTAPDPAGAPAAALSPRSAAPAASGSSAGGRRRTPLLWLLPLAVALAALAGLGPGLWQRRPAPSAGVSRAPELPSAGSRPPAAQGQPTPARPSLRREAEAGSLLLSARGSSWLEVRDGEGRVLYRGLFNGSRRFPLQGRLQVLAGRPDLIAVSGGGRDGAPLGPIDRVVWTTFPAPAGR